MLFVKRGIIELVELRDGEAVTFGTTTIRPFRLHESYVYGFLLEEDRKRVLLIPDELHRWEPTHIEEPDELSYDDGTLLQEKLRAEGLDVTFAYDTLLVDV